MPSLTQSSIAVSPDGDHWLLVNASPDLRQQLAAHPALHPTGLRGSPIAAVALTNGDVDHVAGLLTLREKTAFTLYGTPAIHQVLRENDIFDVLDPTLVRRREIALDVLIEPVPGLSATLFAVAGKAPLYREYRASKAGNESGQTVGIELRANGQRACYVPGCAAMTADLAERLRGAALVLFDGTVWRDDEMIASGVGAKTGARMGHMAMDGPAGSIAAFDGLDIGTKVFVHINNTNPVLDPQRPERRIAEAAGWVIGQDGMEFHL